MKRLLGLLLVVGMVGCGGGDPHPLGKFGAKIDRNEQGEIIRVRLTASHITDAGLMHLKGLTNLQTLELPRQITDAGLAQLSGLTKTCRNSGSAIPRLPTRGWYSSKGSPI